MLEPRYRTTQAVYANGQEIGITDQWTVIDRETWTTVAFCDSWEEASARAGELNDA